ncbi:hypothetical protein GWK91_03295 [Virgibacillus sp. MSP4-1]|uniref:hypothetical protein n=1 Tax=Virgibacillus sp. MSP4-1 TaxID=2700081 RepID=UPI00039BDB01|nr:hypothetical protein [Virgibacillus sp. MSP4-1]QHS22028.1 hypothetical protein GWK91_03295 [Virgibacillus sp. MSP4-1]
MSKTSTISGIIALLLLTILIVLDFFPQWAFAEGMGDTMFWVLLIAMAISIVISGRHQKGHHFKESLFIFIYLIGLILLLTALGGDSVRGFSPDQTGFWVIIFIGIIEVYAQWKRRSAGKHAEK